MTVEYLDLADFLVIAEEITGIEVPVLMKMSRVSLADSALHAPQAGYGDVDLYPDFVDKAAGGRGEAPSSAGGASDLLLWWSGWGDSNSRPLDPQSSALTKLRHSPWEERI